MQQSLLTKVAQIEQEAEALILQARDAAADVVAEMKLRTIESRKSIEAKAGETSRAIIEEHTNEAEKEAHKIAQHGKNVVEKIHETAQNNRKMALAKAKELFNGEYGTDL